MECTKIVLKCIGADINDLTLQFIDDDDGGDGDDDGDDDEWEK